MKSKIRHYFFRKQQCILYSKMCSLFLLLMKLTLNFNK